MLRDLGQLEAFVQIVQSGSMTAAARALGQGVKTVSRRLSALEEACGQTLFVRTTRRLEITDAGQTLYEHAQEILAAVLRAENELKPSEALTGRVRVAMASLNARLEMLHRIAALMREHPALAIDLHVSDEPIEVFAQGFDIAIHVGPLPDSRLVAARLGQIYGWMAATPSYLEQFGAPVAHRDLAGHECLRFRSLVRQTTWPLEDARGNRIEAPIDGRFESNNSRCLYEAMLAGIGIGIGFLPEHDRELERGTLTRVLPELRFGPVPISALMPASMARSRPVRAVLQILRDTVASDGPKTP